MLPSEEARKGGNGVWKWLMLCMALAMVFTAFGMRDTTTTLVSAILLGIYFMLDRIHDTLVAILREIER